MEVLTVDDLSFEVRRSPRRRTLEITLDRGGELRISAPPDVGDERLVAFVREKRFWLYTKMAEKETRQQALGTKEFVSGEGFPYLGRSYRLLLVDEQDAPLKLEAGHARHWLQRRVKGWATRMGVEPRGVEVRDLGFRWGSCGQAGNLNFHWATILLPVSIVDYVVVHELVHLVEPNHTPEFWLRVGRVLPTFEQQKDWLAEHGGRHVVL